ncbi:MAG: GDSL-type esterase/lipase family protein [Carnobacterium sp.]
MKLVRSFILTCLIVALGTFVVVQGLNIMTNKKETPKIQQQVDTPQGIKLVAIGDSLTKGVGDSTQSGGYVPLVANQLKEAPGVNSVTTKNHGVTGERSDEILKRIENQKELQTDIEKADIIVLTAGGNDLIQTFKKEKLNINQESFLQPETAYKKNLSTILKRLNKHNPKAQIYVFGLYNPYDTIFPEVTEMKDILLSWNTATESLAEENGAIYFSLSNIFNGEKETSLSKTNQKSEKTATSDLLYEEDLFHPNDKGYQLIAQQLYRTILNHEGLAN